MTDPWWVEARARLDAIEPRLYLNSRVIGPNALSDRHARNETDIRWMIPEFRRALDVIDTIRGLHARDDDYDPPVCPVCRDDSIDGLLIPWPCPTVRLLDGSDE